MIDYFLLPGGRALHPYEIVVPHLIDASLDSPIPVSSRTGGPSRLTGGAVHRPLAAAIGLLKRSGQRPARARGGVPGGPRA